MALQNIEANITLDLYNHDTTPSAVKAIQLDSQTRYVAAMLQNMGAQYDVDSGATVQLIVIRPDKVGVQITGETFTYGDEGAQFLGPYAELTQVALAVNGKMRGQFKITSGDQILRTEIFAISNGEALDASTDEWADEYDGYNLEEMAADISQIKEDFTDRVNSAYVTDSANGAVVHFTDGADGVPMKSVKVNITPVQSGSGDPSPSNVRPISGWNGVNVMRTGKNLLPMPIVSGSYAYTTVIAVNDDKSFTIAKTNGSGWTSFILGRFMLKQGTYTLIESDDNSSNAQMVLDKVIGDTTEILLTTRNTKRITFTVEADTLVQARYLRSATADNVLTKLMLFVGDTATATDYEPYSGDTYSITFPSSAGTVYGGTLDVVSGELVVNRAIVDLGSLTWSYIPDHKVFSSVIRGIKDIGDTRVPNAISSAFTAGSWTAVATDVTKNAMFCFLPGYNQVRFRNVLYNDAATFKAAMDGVKLCYELATPITYNLTPTEVKSLLGINNIWSDAGDMDVEYRADTKLYIDKRLAEVTA